MDAPLLHPRVARVQRSASSREIQRDSRNLHLRAIRVARDVGDAPPVELAALKVHGLVRARRVQTQRGVEHNQRLQQRRPVRMVKLPQTLQMRLHAFIVRSARRLENSRQLLQQELKQRQLQERRQLPQLADSQHLAHL